MPIRERRGNWHYRFVVNGHEYSGSTDLAATERNRAAAQRVEAKAYQLVMSGRAHELRMEVTPFNEAANRYLDWCDGEYRDHPNSAKRIRTSFASLSAHFGRAAVSSITAGKVEEYKTWRRTEHQVKEVTIRHDLHALSGFFQFAIKHNWARENPVQGVEIPSDKDAVRIHVLSDREEALYFATARTLSMERTVHRAATRRTRAYDAVIATDYSDLLDVATVMLQQGCRPEEVVSLSVGDVDLEGGHLFVRAGKSNAAKRRLPLTAVSREVLARRVIDFPRAVPTNSGAAIRPMSSSGRSHPVGHASGGEGIGKHGQPGRPDAHRLDAGGNQANQGAPGKRVESSHKWLFPSPRVPGQHIAIPQSAHDRVCKAAGLSFVIYDLRHTCATRWAQSGVDPATIAKWLGHADLRTVQKYIHIEESHSDAMAKRAEEYRATMAAPVEQRKERVN